jgi:hypothetical protein
MAYAGDLKSPDAEASCGFDPHPGYHRFILKLNQLILPGFRVPLVYPAFLEGSPDLVSMGWRDPPPALLARPHPWSITFLWQLIRKYRRYHGLIVSPPRFGRNHYVAIDSIGSATKDFPSKESA